MFIPVQASAGNTCGRNFLDEYIAAESVKFVAKDMERLLSKLKSAYGVRMSAQEFLGLFDYDTARRNFSNSSTMSEYTIGYQAEDMLPVNLDRIVSVVKAVSLPRYESITSLHDKGSMNTNICRTSFMKAAHDTYLAKLYPLIDDHVVLVLRSSEQNHLLFIGGLTRSKYISKALSARYDDLDSLNTYHDVDRFDQPAVEIGCILSASQPAI